MTASGGDTADGRGDQAPWIAALMSLPSMWPSRLAALLGLRRTMSGDETFAPQRTPYEVWESLRRGTLVADERLRARCRPDPEGVIGMWRRAALGVSVVASAQAYRRHHVRVSILGGPGYPPELAGDPEAPYVVFTAGDTAVLDGPCVAVVGTRRCTPGGCEIAAEFGRGLTEAGVHVVSGLALGIDGAAHAGALGGLVAQPAAAAGPIGVVAGGLDRPYPARHRVLWAEVARAGVVLSEAPLGVVSESWRFPARNRVLAALADAVVVVESHEKGGSLITVDAALARGVPVMAVPGSIRSPASEGTNRLLRDGAAPACSVDDVLAVLALQCASSGDPPLAATPRPPAEHRRVPDELAPVLAAVDWSPTTTETVLVRTGLDAGAVTAALVALEVEGWLIGGGGWWERRQP